MEKVINFLCEVCERVFSIIILSLGMVTAWAIIAICWGIFGMDEGNIRSREIIDEILK